jgi:hypothetical protein
MRGPPPPRNDAMPLTFASLKDSIRHTLGGDPAPGASYSRIINGAGRAWTAMHDWYYLGNREATLTATPGDEFVSLTPVSDIYGVAKIVTQTEIVEAKQWSMATTHSSYLAALVQRPVNGVIATYLRFFPTPSNADQFTLIYDATWGEVNEDEDVIPIPSYAEHVFEEVVRAYARGLEEEDMATLAQRLGAIKESPLFRDVTRRDALTTGAIIRPGVGAAQDPRPLYTRWNHPNNLG